MLYTIENESIRLQINSLGAEPYSIFDKVAGEERLWQGDATIWGRRSPILFPHCGAIRDAKIVVDGITYPAKQHGFGRDLEHSLVSQTMTEIWFTVADNEATRLLYPFAFHLRTGFRLEGNEILFLNEVENRGEGMMPFTIGYHTAFLCPLPKAEYALVFDQVEEATCHLCDEKGLITGETKPFFHGEREIPLQAMPFADSYVLSNLQSKTLSLVEKKSGRRVRFFIEGFPYVVLWSPLETPKFLCIEPWFGLPDRVDTDGNYRNKIGSQELASGEIFTCCQKVALEG